ncbi:MAG: hypothetical protein ORN28_00815 [Rhodoferax sp.]|nr:hypothetical protein [Rhodoferax sp.]
MKTVLTVLCCASTLCLAQTADNRVYRCGNEYTNTVSEADAKNCKLLSTANVTLIPAVKPPPRTAPSSAGRPDAADQRAKESDARLILEAELKKAQNKQAELLKEYNNGEPDRLGTEARNHQKYLDRVAALKATIARTDADIAGIQRELARLDKPGSADRNADRTPERPATSAKK